MKQEKCTVQQIMSELREILVQGFNAGPITPEARIDEYLKANELEDLDLMDLAFGLERGLGFRVSRDEWVRFFTGSGSSTLEEWEREVGPRFTFGHLVEFIQNRMTAV